MKSKRVYVNLENFDKTESGKRKVWRTDGQITHCASFEPSLFIWEKNSKHNDYNGYSGYVHPNCVEEVA